MREYKTSEAQRALVKTWFKAHPNYRRDYLRSHPERRERQRLYYQKWYAEHGRRRAIDSNGKARLYSFLHKEANRARRTARIAIQQGKLAKPAQCSICGHSKRLHSHHEDYTKPLEVIWMCASCHKLWHYRPQNQKEPIIAVIRSSNTLTGSFLPGLTSY